MDVSSATRWGSRWTVLIAGSSRRFFCLVSHPSLLLQQLKHVSMCCENTGEPAGAELLANWTVNINGNLQSGHGFGFWTLVGLPSVTFTDPKWPCFCVIAPVHAGFPFLQSPRAKHTDAIDKGRRVFLLSWGQQSRATCDVSKRGEETCGSWLEYQECESVKGSPSSQ